MTTDELTRKLRDVLEYSPNGAGLAAAPELAGVTMTADDGSAFVCVRCTARIIARGCGHMLRGDAVWADRVPAAEIPSCALCGATPDAFVPLFTPDPRD
jgi:hypothetical protein